MLGTQRQGMESTGKVPDMVGWVGRGRKTDPSHAEASLGDLGESLLFLVKLVG